MFAVFSQILELIEEPCGLSSQFHEVHHQLALPPLPIHRGLRSAGHAAFWRTVSNLSIYSAPQLLFSPFYNTHTRAHTSSPLLPFPSLHLTLLLVCDPRLGGADRRVDAAGSWQSSSTVCSPLISLSAGAPCLLMTGTPHDSVLAAVNQRPGV